MQAEQIERSVGANRSPHITHKRGDMKSNILVSQLVFISVLHIYTLSDNVKGKASAKRKTH